MKKKFILIVSGIIVLACSACKREGVDIPEEALAGLHKPVINSISPAAILFNNAGFSLLVNGVFEDAAYVLYINERQIGQAVPSYWRNELRWSIPKALLSELLAASPAGVIASVRVTGISQFYDISGDFEKYRDYLSAPAALEIKKGATQFSEAKKLFPQWNHSREPIIRSDKHGNLYLAWIETVGDISQAFFSFSGDGGSTWSQVLNISRSKNYIYKLGLAVDDTGHFFMVWEEESGVFFSRSLDNGKTWRLPVKMNTAAEKSTKPVIDINDRGDVLVAWYRWENETYPDIRLALSGDLGQSWQNRDFAAPGTINFYGEPVLATGTGGSVCLFSGEEDYGNQGFYFFFSNDYGVKWQAQKKALGNISPFMDYSTARYGPENQIYIVWGWQNTLGHMTSTWNYFLRRESSAAAWSEVQSLHDRCYTSSSQTAIAISGKRVDVVMSSGGVLFLLRSGDEGRSWTCPEFIPGTDCASCYSYFADMALQPSGKTFLVFVSMTGMESSLNLMQFQ